MVIMCEIHLNSTLMCILSKFKEKRERESNLIPGVVW